MSSFSVELWSLDREGVALYGLRHGRVSAPAVFRVKIDAEPHNTIPELPAELFGGSRCPYDATMRDATMRRRLIDMSEISADSGSTYRLPNRALRFCHVLKIGTRVRQDKLRAVTKHNLLSENLMAHPCSFDQIRI